jgi:prepilin-type N-terminal cleavage/methylation domain-containing protein
MSSTDGLRRGFSLLEVMIATAILAASAMVLLSLISLGTRFGSKAETRISALVQAVSIMDETVLAIYAGTTQESFSSVLGGPEPRAYRVQIEPISMVEEGSFESSLNPNDENGSIGATNGFSTPSGGNPFNASNVTNPVAPAASSPPIPSELVSITVELFDSADSATLGGTDAKPLIQLHRLLRRQPTNDSGTLNSERMGTASRGL